MLRAILYHFKMRFSRGEWEKNVSVITALGEESQVFLQLTWSSVHEKGGNNGLRSRSVAAFVPPYLISFQHLLGQKDPRARARPAAFLTALLYPSSALQPLCFYFPHTSIFKTHLSMPSSTENGKKGSSPFLSAESFYICSQRLAFSLKAKVRRLPFRTFRNSKWNCAFQTLTYLSGRLARWPISVTVLRGPQGRAHSHFLNIMK